MRFKRLSHAGAFSGGSDLWLMPSAGQSSWTRKVDWYLNFQMAKARSHQSKALPEPLIQILTANELKLKRVDNCSPDSPLLLPSSHRLPNQYTVELAYRAEAEGWLNQAFAIWQKMGRPSFRIFLPTAITQEQLVGLWPHDPQATAEELLGPPIDSSGPGYLSFVPGDLPLEA